MSYLLARPSSTRRGSLLGIVVALHVGVALLILAAKTVVPQLLETPLIVDLIQPMEPPKLTEAKPLPMVRPQPMAPRPQARVPQPAALESTTSTVAANNAPVAVPAEPKPAPSLPASEPVTQARFDADYLKNPAPSYPPSARRMGEEGKVVLHVQVSPQGSAEQVDIKASSGSVRLDEAAANTVRHWKFIPARRGDTPVQSWVLVPIIFKLEQ